jgi:hypothetical protein
VVEAVKHVIEDRRRRAYRHAGVGNLDVTCPFRPIEYVIPEISRFMAALMEAIKQVIEDDRRRAA